MTNQYYSWANPCRLDTLKVWGENNILYFETEKEKAHVHFSGPEISKVEWRTPQNSGEISLSQASSIVVGDGNTRRDVFHYLKPNGPLPTMRLGITKHSGSGGTWSSLPHDFELNTEPDFEEVFFYILEGGPQKAIQVGRGVWFDNLTIDGVWPVTNNTFSTIPMGYHPVVGEPNVRVSYVWVYLAKKKSWEKI